MKMIHALALFTLISSHAFAGCGGLRALAQDEGIAVARETATRLLHLRDESEVDEILLNPIAAGALVQDRRSPEQWNVKGVPKAVVPFATEGVTFRHYVQSEEGYRAILESSRLLSGYVSYAQVARHTYHKAFVDLTGVFLTTPDATAESIGLDASTRARYYIDVTLDAQVAVLRIERDIYVVPLPRRIRDWAKKPGDDSPTYGVPVKIVAHGAL